MPLKQQQLSAIPAIGFIALLFIVLNSCQTGPKHKLVISGNLLDSVQVSDSVRPSRILSVKLDDKDTLERYDLDEHLFGRFFGNRASFYIIKNPNNRINGVKVKSMTLYYLDGSLFKTKYILDKNISEFLINNYPQFTLRGFDVGNRKILSNEKIFYRKKKKWYLNSTLDNYEIIWRLGRNEMKMRVNANDTIATYQYIVNNKNYDRILTSIENSE